MRDLTPPPEPPGRLIGPQHLRDATRTWWEDIAADFDLEPHHLMLLTAAAEAWDRLQEARERIAKDGAYLKDRFGQLKPHPALAVERDSRIGFARLVRELNLDVETPEEPRLPRIAGRNAGNG